MTYDLIKHGFKIIFINKKIILKARKTKKKKNLPKERKKLNMTKINLKFKPTDFFSWCHQ